MTWRRIQDNLNRLTSGVLVNAAFYILLHMTMLFIITSLQILFDML